MSNRKHQHQGFEDQWPDQSWRLLWAYSHHAHMEPSLSEAMRAAQFTPQMLNIFKHYVWQELCTFYEEGRFVFKTYFTYLVIFLGFSDFWPVKSCQKYPYIGTTNPIHSSQTWPYNDWIANCWMAIHWWSTSHIPFESIPQYETSSQQPYPDAPWCRNIYLHVPQKWPM